MNNKKLKTGNGREDKTYEDVEQITFEVNRRDSNTDIEINIPTLLRAEINTKLDPNNCKLAYIYNIERLLSANILRDRKKLIKNLLLTIFEKYANRVIVYVTVTREENMNFIKSNFKCYFINMIPFGDDTGVQYHIAIMNERALKFNSTLINAINKNPVVSIHVFEEKDSIDANQAIFGTKSNQDPRRGVGLMEQLRRSEVREVDRHLDIILERPNQDEHHEQPVQEDEEEARGFFQ